jgi:hypothetical protein
MASREISPELCYLDAECVNSPAGVLSEFDVVTAAGEQVGSIAGVVIEASARRARYIDVRSHGLRRRRYLLPADQLAQVDSERKQLRLLTADVPEADRRDSARFRPFSDDDLIAAVLAADEAA